MTLQKYKINFIQGNKFDKMDKMQGNKLQVIYKIQRKDWVFEQHYSPANRFSASSSSRCTVHSSIGMAPMLR